MPMPTESRVIHQLWLTWLTLGRRYGCETFSTPNTGRLPVADVYLRDSMAIAMSLINQPPGTAKSWLSNIVVPAYQFAKNPGFQSIQLSYTDKRPKEDGRILIRLMKSDWYRRRFPHVHLTSATPARLETSAGGYRWEQVSARASLGGTRI